MICWTLGRSFLSVLQPRLRATVRTSAARLSETESESSTASEGGQSSGMLCVLSDPLHQELMSAVMGSWLHGATGAGAPVKI